MERATSETPTAVDEGTAEDTTGPTTADQATANGAARTGQLSLSDSASSRTLYSAFQAETNNGDVGRSGDGLSPVSNTATAEAEPQRRTGRPHLPRLRHRSASQGKKEQQAERALREVAQHRGAGGGAPLQRKRRLGRLNLALRWLTPSYKTKNDDFKRLFKHELPDDAVLIDDYSCAIQRDVLVHGRLYLSQEHLCFYANIFGWETLLVFAFADIAALTREKMAHVIPNALQITMKEPVAKPKTYFFASFVSRDTSYMVIMKVWQNMLMGSPMSPQHLHNYALRCWGQTPEVSVDEESIPSLPADLDLSLSGSPDLRDDHSPVDGGQSSRSSGVEDEAERGDMDGEDDEEIDEPDSDGEGEVECGCPEHPEPVFINEVYNLNAESLFELLFTPSEFYRRFMDKRKMFDLRIASWSDASDPVEAGEPDGGGDAGGRRRTVHFTVTVKGGLGPRFAPSVESQHLLSASKPRKVYRVEAESTNSGVPYGDAFYTYLRYCITRVSRTSARLRIAGCIKYRKKVFSMVRSMIERAANDGMVEHYQELKASLLEEIARRQGNTGGAGTDQPDGVSASNQLASESRSSLLSTVSSTSASTTSSIQSTREDRPQPLTTTKSASAVGSTRGGMIMNLVSSASEWLVDNWMAILLVIFLLSLWMNLYFYFRAPPLAGDAVACRMNPWLEVVRRQNEDCRRDLSQWRQVVQNHTETMSKVADILQLLVQEKFTCANAGGTRPR